MGSQQQWEASHSLQDQTEAQKVHSYRCFWRSKTKRHFLEGQKHSLFWQLARHILGYRGSFLTQIHFYSATYAHHNLWKTNYTHREFNRFNTCHPFLEVLLSLKRNALPHLSLKKRKNLQFKQRTYITQLNQNQQCPSKVLQFKLTSSCICILITPIS